MTFQKDIPKRTRIPDKYPYITVSKKSFVELISNLKSILKEQLKHAHDVEINVSGFSGEFNDEKIFVETLTDREWDQLRTITVYFYFKDRSKYGYHHSLRVLFGGYIGEDGLSVSYGDKVTDIHKIAIKQSIDVVITSYSRTVYLSRNSFAAICCAVATGGTIWLYLATTGERALELLPTLLPLGLPLMVFIAWMSYLIPSQVHQWAIPNFETTTNPENLKIKRISRIAVVAGGVLAALGTILSFIQFFQQGGLA